MFGRLFPRQIDNTYRGLRLGLWLFAFYIAIKFVQGFDSVFFARETAIGADGLPLDSYGAAGADAAVALFARLGINLVAVPLLGVLALIRYRAMVPLLALLLLLLNGAIRLVGLYYPIAHPGDAHPIGFWVNLGLLAILFAAFIIALVPGKAR